jgi:uncharacterized protein with von Willebrand factor type A (vWA) domain
MSETVDAARALETIDVSDQVLFRSALCATLVKSGDHISAFDTAYEIFFATRQAPGDFEGAADTSRVISSRDGSSPSPQRSGATRQRPARTAQQRRRGRRALRRY